MLYIRCTDEERDKAQKLLKEIKDMNGKKNIDIILSALFIDKLAEPWRKK